VNVLLDHCVPRAFGRLLVGHSVRTTGSMKWDGLRNGELLAVAAAQFGVFITVDGGIRHQQNVGELPVPVFALVAPSNKIEDVAPLAPRLLVLLGTRLERRVYIVKA
jgi:hypothetical protein